MYHCYHITESNFDYILTITSEFYATFLCFMMLFSVLLLKELPLAFLVRQI